MDMLTLRAFEAEIVRHVPGFKIAYKDELLWMRLLGFLVAPFNSKFMTTYTTTFGRTVYVPSRAYYESNPTVSFTVLAHEFVHLLDTQKSPLWFPVSYLLPQLLAPFVLGVFMFVPWGWAPVGALAVSLTLGCLCARWSLTSFFALAGVGVLTSLTLAIGLTHWWAFLFFAGLLLCLPFPSPWRVHWEMRGYGMNMALLSWIYKIPFEPVARTLATHFYGPDYYYMSWSRETAKVILELVPYQTRNGALLQDPHYRTVYEFLRKFKLLLRV